MGWLGNLAGAAVSGISALFGGKMASDANAKLQRDFAQNAVQWKVQDALKAGIHPLYALGAPTMSPSMSVGGLGEGLASMGQDVGRAIAQGGNAADRELMALQAERVKAETGLIQAQTAKLVTAGTGPPSPIGSTAVIPGQEQITPKVRFMGQDIPTDLGTSDMQTFENRYGDEGPVAMALPFAVLAADIKKNLSQMSLADILRWIDRKTATSISVPQNYSVSRGRYYPGKRR